MSKIRNEKIGYIFQDYKLVEDFTVYENIQIPLLIGSNVKYTRINKSVKEALNNVGLPEKLLNQKVSKLSGGEKQRVAIARSIVKKPKLILADEPTGAIDYDSKEIIMDLIRNLNDNETTIVLVTHDKDIANYADKIYKIEDKKLVEIQKY